MTKTMLHFLKLYIKVYYIEFLLHWGGSMKASLLDVKIFRNLQ